MNLDKLFSWIAAVVIACAAVGQLDALQNWVMRAQAKVIYESRSSTWGSPRFFKKQTTNFGKVSQDFSVDSKTEVQRGK